MDHVTYTLITAIRRFGDDREKLGQIWLHFNPI